MKTYPLNNSDKDRLSDYKKAFESYKEAVESDLAWRINSAHNWLLSMEFEAGTALRKSGFPIDNPHKRWDRNVVYNHICGLNIS